MPVARVTIDNLDVAAEVFLLKTLSTVAGQHVRYIDYDILRLVGVRKGVLVEPSPLGPSQLDMDPRAQECLVVSYFSNLLLRQY